MSNVVGIDLGTTNSCIAVVEAGVPTVIINGDGGRTTPSVIAFSKEGERLVGQAAKRQMVLNPDRTVSSIKREMGTRNRQTIDGKDYSPEELSAMILGKLKKDAEEYLGVEIKDAVITVPAYFDDTQRKATKQAGEIAGLNVLRIINEPTAASLAYGKDEQKLEGTILVYDLGGGTFDVSILDVEIDKTDKETGDYYEVLATSGDTKLGGDDFDEKIIEYVCDEFKKDVGIDLRDDKHALQRVRDAAEKAKCELSSSINTTISLPFITSIEGEGPKHLEVTLTRAKFEELVNDLIDKTLTSVDTALNDANLTNNDIDKILLVGGSTRIPKVQEVLRERLGDKVEKGLNPDEVVALGAGIQANILAGNGDSTDMVLIDVIPLTLGIETLGDVFDVLIEKNTSIPTKVERTYSTASDNQTTVEVHILQGERKRASTNKSLGRFHLSGIPPAPRGIPQIDVAFDIDANGLLEVSAKDKATGKEQSIVITGSGQLSDEEVEKMEQEATQHAEEDEKFAELANAKNEADSMAYQMRQTMEDIESNMTEEDKKNIESKLETLEEVKNSDNVDAIRAAMDEVNAAFSEVSQRIYQQASQQAQEAPQDMPPTDGEDEIADDDDDDDVIDAEFEAEDKQ